MKCIVEHVLDDWKCELYIFFITFHITHKIPSTSEHWFFQACWEVTEKSRITFTTAVSQPCPSFPTLFFLIRLFTLHFQLIRANSNVAFCVVLAIYACERKGKSRPSDQSTRQKGQELSFHAQLNNSRLPLHTTHTHAVSNLILFLRFHGKFCNE